MGDDLVDLLWKSVEPTLYITKEQFVSSLEGWTIEPVEIGSELAIITLTNGAHFHFYTLGTRKTISFGMIRRFLQNIIDQHGFAATKTPKEDARQRRFNERLGFVAVGYDEYDVHYRIERLRHAPKR